MGTLGSMVTTVTNSTGPHTVPLDSHPNALDAVARDRPRLMPNLDITDILMDIMDTPMDLDITDTPIIMDTVLSDLESLDMLAVEPLLLPEAPKVSASKTAILWCSLNFAQMTAIF